MRKSRLGCWARPLKDPNDSGCRLLDAPADGLTPRGQRCCMVDPQRSDFAEKANVRDAR